MDTANARRHKLNSRTLHLPATILDRAALAAVPFPAANNAFGNVRKDQEETNALKREMP